MCIKYPFYGDVDLQIFGMLSWEISRMKGLTKKITINFDHVIIRNLESLHRDLMLVDKGRHHTNNEQVKWYKSSYRMPMNSSLCIVVSVSK
jgi:hypothetical protein